MTRNFSHYTYTYRLAISIVLLILMAVLSFIFKNILVFPFITLILLTFSAYYFCYSTWYDFCYDIDYTDQYISIIRMYPSEDAHVFQRNFEITELKSKGTIIVKDSLGNIGKYAYTSEMLEFLKEIQIK